jgi:hypothetical protein
MGVTQMYLPHEMAKAAQQELLESAQAQRQALRVHALSKAARQVERAEHRLTRSRLRVMRLRSDLAAGQHR